ncbi:MAG: DNA primase [Pseudomonadota bacterium]
MTKFRLPDGFLDEIKARVRPSDVIGRKVALKRQGKEWVGLSPFTSEKTPSFYVNDEKGIFKDFSSGLGGDVIKFLMETERLEFMEAVERLAGEAGLELPKATPKAVEAYDRAQRLRAACAVAERFFQDQLRAGGGAEARAYLSDKRGLGPEAWARWSIGFAPADWRTLYAHLTKNGFTREEIIGAGLAKVSDKGGEPYDVFRARIMFPITDTRGETIAFGGRALDPEEKAKYLNSPETDLFQKSRILYNYKRARSALGYGGRGGLVVCEGYMDVIAMGEAGFEAAVAPLGTALTPSQLALLWRAGPDPVMCFDGDRAGRGAAHRCIDVALPEVLPDRSVYFAFLPDGLDPDDLLKTSDGAQRMSGLLTGAAPLVDVVWQRERDREPLATPEQKAGLEARLQACAGQIAHGGVRSAYQRDLFQKMREHFWALRLAARDGGPGGAAAAKLKAPRKAPPALGQLVRAASSPELVEDQSERLAAIHFGHPISDAICDAIIDVHCQTGTVDPAGVAACLAQAGAQAALEAFQAYPSSGEIRIGSQDAREWDLLLRLYLEKPAEAAAGDTLGDRGALSKDARSWAALHRDVAERRRLLSDTSEAQIAAYEARKKGAPGS